MTQMPQTKEQNCEKSLSYANQNSNEKFMYNLHTENVSKFYLLFLAEWIFAKGTSFFSSDEQTTIDHS